MIRTKDPETESQKDMEHYTMNLTLKVWRQKNADSKGRFETYEVKDISSEMSFLEMFDVLNERLIREGKELSGYLNIILTVFVVACVCTLVLWSVARWLAVWRLTPRGTA